MLKLFIIVISASLCVAKYENISLIDFDLPCTLANGEDGKYAILSKCPVILQEMKLGGKFPRVCDSKEVCWDVVCCHGEMDYGSKFDVIDRLENATCVVPGTDIKGTYIHQKYCPSLIDESISRDPVCQFTLCENIICCPPNTTAIIEESANVDFYHETCKFDKSFDAGREYKRHKHEGCDIESDSSDGNCRPYFQCEALADSYNYENDTFSQNVTLCGYNCCVPIVCCPYTYKKYSPLTPSSQCSAPSPYWAYYFLSESLHLDSKRSLTCTSDNTTIVESQKKLYTKEEGRMYSVLLGYLSLMSGDTNWDCEGVVLNTGTILTTATCLDFSKKGPLVSIRIGKDNYEVKKVIIHPLYKRNLIYHDIGIVKTKTTIELPDKYQRSCLPQSRDVLNQEQLFAGNADSTNKSEIKIVGLNKCKATVSKFKNGELKYGILDEIQFCADLIDLNTGDCPLKMVGSPLISKNGNVVGLNEVERQCEKDQPASLFESVYPYVRWIELYMKN